jgi:serine/threonine-protein kinase
VQRNQAQSELNIEAKDLGLTYTELWEDELKRRFKAAAFMPLSPGLIMKGGSLTVVRQLALGGLSAVYLCQLDGKKLVVLKESVVPEDAKAELKDKAREMFAREAQLLMKISHPHIVQVLDYFVEGGRSYLMLDYVSGQDLRQYVKQNGRLREFQVIEWAKQIAAILAYLHNQEPPILHRDFTPDNLVVCADQSIVAIDFGAANEFIGNATGTFVGKQAFIAPEQFRGKACIQSDIYAFGGTIFYLLTGEDPEALSQSEPSEMLEISPGLNRLVADCTALELDGRIKSADEVLERLKALKSG